MRIVIKDPQEQTVAIMNTSHMKEYAAVYILKNDNIERVFVLQHRPEGYAFIDVRRNDLTHSDIHVTCQKAISAAMISSDTQVFEFDSFFELAKFVAEKRSDKLMI